MKNGACFLGGDKEISDTTNTNPNPNSKPLTITVDRTFHHHTTISWRSSFMTGHKRLSNLRNVVFWPFCRIVF